MERITIKKTGINGEGIGYYRKKVCFIDGAFEGEEVEAVLTSSKNFYKGEVNKILKKSPYRISSLCKEEKQCKGCAFTSLEYARQLLAKENILKDTINKHAEELDITVDEVIGCNQTEHYKTHAELPITFLSGKVVAGIYQRDTKYLTVMDHCLLNDEMISSTLVKIEEILNKYHVRDYNDKVKKGLRFIELKKVENGIQVLFVTGTNGIEEHVTKAISKIDTVASIFYTINTSRYQSFDEKGYKKIYGDTKGTVIFNDTKYVVSFKSDLPLNLTSEKQKLDLLKQYIPSTDKVISLGCKTGFIELGLENEIVAFDSNKIDIEDAKNNANFLKKDNIVFKNRDSKDGVVTECKKTHFNTMILNGKLSESMLESLNKSKIEQLVYINDHPTEAVKDLTQLVESYNVEKVILLDNMPYTSKFETIIIYNRK